LYKVFFEKQRIPPIKLIRDEIDIIIPNIFIEDLPMCYCSDAESEEEPPQFDIVIKAANEIHAFSTECSLGGGSGRRGRGGMRKNNRNKKRNNPDKRREKRMTVIPKARGYSDEATLVWLTFIDGTSVRNNAGATFYSWAIRITDPYDPDPLILTTGVSGFFRMVKFLCRMDCFEC